MGGVEGTGTYYVVIGPDGAILCPTLCSNRGRSIKRLKKLGGMSEGKPWVSLRRKGYTLKRVRLLFVGDDPDERTVAELRQKKFVTQCLVKC